ncbi:hypothetical protein A2V54_01930 [candidate division WWE3 bacterium RBG_19FT_COMBO_53_11]|uniref:AAA family ATPase n=1 Tax=candidate division WWE3 bacterium RBG_19FT_COMBO_53_11 TaxID=1802613 RepID=A0A1F4UHT2_UNCKA|nr:MAG: hypothetical protein A2155_01210 [candidate division WWE3 bacterium RBG_16_52_45]OGC44515.1 MAG: hypothetical protein A2V54_01930 [candidate division WWE3 bacterium RBG_19FT_COMBO_53_11]
MAPQEILARGREVSVAIESEIAKVVFGDEIKPLVDILITALWANGHVLARAPVGTAKTLACNALAKSIGGVFRKRQFRPDMLPSEISGFEIYNQKTREFEVHHGPLFGTNVFLADEINRGTPKSQSALLEAMEERYVTISSTVFELEPGFLVLATRNPMEHEGTYPLPEAQLDRIFAQPIIKEISLETILLIIKDPDYHRIAGKRLERIQAVTDPAEVIAIREAIFAAIHVEDRLERYIASLVVETWNHDQVGYGVSPRGAIDLKKAATVAAFREGRDYAEPEDVRRYAVDILAHRIFFKPDYQADAARDVSPADIVRKVLADVRYE